MVRDAIRVSAFGEDHVELREVVHDIANDRGQINRRRLGWWIRRHAGRFVGGRRFVRASGNRSAEAWQVESVSPVSPVPVTSRAESVIGTSTEANVDACACSG